MYNSSRRDLLKAAVGAAFAGMRPALRMDARALGNDDRQTAVLDFSAYDLDILRVRTSKRGELHYVVLAHPKPAYYSNQVIAGCKDFLAAGHGNKRIVEDDDGDVHVVVCGPHERA